MCGYDFSYIINLNLSYYVNIFPSVFLSRQDNNSFSYLELVASCIFFTILFRRIQKSCSVMLLILYVHVLRCDTKDYSKLNEAK